MVTAFTRHGEIANSRCFLTASHGENGGGGATILLPVIMKNWQLASQTVIGARTVPSRVSGRDWWAVYPQISVINKRRSFQCLLLTCTELAGLRKCPSDAPYSLTYYAVVKYVPHDFFASMTSVYLAIHDNVSVTTYG